MRRRRNRRGLALMMVLSLMVLFLLMGISFLMVANQTERGARAQGKKERRGDTARKHHDMALGQVLRGTNVKSFVTPLSGHQILGDIYGNDGADGTIETLDDPFAPPTPVQTAGQFIAFTSTNVGRPWLTESVAPASPRELLPPLAHYLNGRVITMVTGAAKGLSSRIVESGPVPGAYYIRMEAFENGVLPAVGDRFVVNGQPFNGSGAGYNPSPATGLNDRPDAAGREIALLPNFSTSVGPSVANVGGADESYDAVDYQNMFLAKVPANVTAGTEIIPSYHRPALVNFWQNRFTTSGTSPADQKDTIRRFVLRPTQLDNFNPGTNTFFTGSNPAFNILINSTTPNQAQLTALLNALKSGSWDVDNDNDGIPDSIWLDLEFPLITSRNGRSVKPLVAILVKDLDGRLNLNAHGNLAQTSGMYVNVATGQLVAATGDFGGNPPAATKTVPRGRGYGPAEIYFGHVLDPANRATELNNLFAARYTGTSQPGAAGSNDPLSVVKALRFPTNYPAQPPAQPRTPYGSPPDVAGYDAVALNFSGQAFSERRGLAPAPSTDPTVDDAYELNLFRFKSSEPNALDSPLTIAELERLLRFPDLDAAVLPNRILQAANASFGQNTTPSRERRNLVTTESRHVPVPNTRFDVEHRGLATPSNPTARQAPNISDLLAARLAASGLPAAQIDVQLELQLPFEIRRGQLMNLNRLFGNGFDDDGNGAVDDPGEADVGEKIWQALGLPAAFNNADFDYDNDEPGVTLNRWQRQMYARHLYCLMMLLVDDGQTSPSWKLDLSFTENIPGSTPAEKAANKRELVARRIAQWAINVVDFRDPDAIMTPFEYDVDPFNGWDLRINGHPSTVNIPPDNNPGNDQLSDLDPSGTVSEPSDRRIVWGMEYPDLLITEATAFHDRRVKDTMVDDNEQKKRKDGDEEGDNDLDQYRLPQGSLFLELYCPRNRVETDGGAYAKFPLELYSVPNPATPFLQLGRMAPNGPLGRHPVWRVAISEPNSAAGAVDTLTEASSRPDSISFQPEDMSLFGWQNRTAADAATAGDVVGIERHIWFANVAPSVANVSGQGVPHSRIYWNRHTNTNLPAGGYAVVGPRLVTNIGSWVEPGLNLQTTKPTYQPSKQRIELQAGGAVYYDRNNVPLPGVASAQPALSIIAAAARPTAPTAPATWQRASADLGLGLGSDDVVGIGISVSEPFPDGAYYPEPTTSLNSDFPQQDSWYDQMDPLTSLPDEPFDVRPGMPLENLTKTGTTQNYKTAFLQRLANPREPYNPLLNPYITVDWTSIDLTVFSGEEDTDQTFDVDSPAPMTDIWLDPNDEDPYEAAPPAEQFDSREKGATKLAAPPTAPFDNVNIWTHTTTTPQTLPPAGGIDDDYFKFNLRNTLGFLNSTFSPPRGAPPAYRGDPIEPWPWLTWNNRPFDTPLELMNVPATTLSRLPHEFTLQSGADPYKDNDASEFRGPYHHLLNFFNTSTNQNVAPHFYRLFDYVETPSPFIGAERWYPPPPFATATDILGFRPPYNYLSRFRDPGRINLNTIFDRPVFEGLMKGFPAMDPIGPNATAAWDAFQNSREGFGGLSPNDFPTQFAQPFRSTAQADMAPLSNMRKSGVQASLLRSHPTQANQPLFDFTSTDSHNNTARNPAFRYAGLQRLANLVGTHSNVFAVWITVGYFEVETVPAAVNPRGYALGQEVGLDTGNVARHRAFYVIDRSIPVAYEPGENHNIDQCILIRRVIE